MPIVLPLTMSAPYSDTVITEEYKMIPEAPWPNPSEKTLIVLRDTETTPPRATDIVEARAQPVPVVPRLPVRTLSSTANTDESKI